MATLVKIQVRALYNDISQIITICLYNVTSPKENHMMNEYKKFQLFSSSTLPIVLILSARFACQRVCHTEVNELLVVHVSMGTFVQTQKGYYSGTN